MFVCLLTIYIIKIYYNADVRGPVFHNQRLSKDRRKGKKRKIKAVNVEANWIYDSWVHSGEHKKLDKPNPISTYSTVENRRVK